MAAKPKTPKALRVELTAGEALRASARASELEQATRRLRFAQEGWEGFVSQLLQDRNIEAPTSPNGCVAKIECDEKTPNVVTLEVTPT